MLNAQHRPNVVVTCSARKSRAPLPGLSIRELTAIGLVARLDQWVERFANASANSRVKAELLYQGDHWSKVKEVASRDSGGLPAVRVWVASAGCGLISLQAAVPPYAATFSPRHEDTVAQTFEERRQWWEGLAAIRFNSVEPRSLHSLAKAFPRAPLVVVGSPEYLSAMSGDLQQAADSVSSTEQISIFCREGALLGALDHFRVHLGADLSSVLGGALASLNARALNWLVGQLGRSLHRRAIEEALGELRLTATTIRKSARSKSTDDQIRSFIRDTQAENPEVSASAALRRFRKAGMAAEQKRFGNLYRAVREGVRIG